MLNRRCMRVVLLQITLRSLIGQEISSVLQSAKVIMMHAVLGVVLLSQVDLVVSKTWCILPSSVHAILSRDR